jgi:hypothetical protein
MASFRHKNLSVNWLLIQYSAGREPLLTPSGKMEQVYYVLALVVAITIGVVVFFMFKSLKTKALSKLTVELHGYQKDFLDELAIARGLGGAAGALQALVDQALGSEKVSSDIFDVFHCVHCGGVSPAEWISTRKGTKVAYDFAVTKDAATFLSKALLVPVEKRGDPPKRQVVEGPRRADVSKAARCCIDWAIKEYGATSDGKVKADKGKKQH